MRLPSCLVLFLHILLLVYRNTIYVVCQFCIVQNYFLSSSSFGGFFRGVYKLIPKYTNIYELICIYTYLSLSIWTPYHLQTEAVLFFPFWFECLLFLFLACLCWLTLQVLSWIRIVKVGNLVLFMILRGKAFRFWPLSMMLVVNLSYMAFIIMSFFQSFRVFNHEMMLYIAKYFFQI